MGLFSSLFGSGKNTVEVTPDEIHQPTNQILEVPNNIQNHDPFEQNRDVFKTDNFKNASIKERMEAYQALENKMAHDQGRAARQVVFDSEVNLAPNSGYCGYYKNEKGDSIHLNSHYLTDECAENGNQFDGMNTVIHEGRHAYQYDAAFGYADVNDENYIKNQGAINKSLRDEVYQAGNQKNPITGKSSYSSMACERDAFQYANETMKSDYFQEAYGNDPNFVRQVENDSIQLKQMDNDAYYNDAVDNMLFNNPEAMKQHMQNIRFGMSPQESFNSVFGNENGNNFESQLNSEIEHLKQETPVDEKIASYTDNLVQHTESEQITPSDLQQYAYVNYQAKPDATPTPENYSTVNEENRNGNFYQSQYGADESNLNSNVYRQVENSDYTYNPDANRLDSVKNDIAKDYENSNVLDISANYMDSNNNEDYAKSNVKGGSGNDYDTRYPNGVEEVGYNEFNNENQNSDYLSQNEEAESLNEVDGVIPEKGETQEQTETLGLDNEKNDTTPEKNENREKIETLGFDDEESVQNESSAQNEESGVKPEENESESNENSQQEENGYNEFNNENQNSDYLSQNEEAESLNEVDGVIPEKGETQEETETLGLDNEKNDTTPEKNENREKIETLGFDDEESVQNEGSAQNEESGVKPEENEAESNENSQQEENGSLPENEESVQNESSAQNEESGVKPEENEAESNENSQQEENGSLPKNEESVQNESSAQNEESGAKPEESEAVSSKESQQEENGSAPSEESEQEADNAVSSSNDNDSSSGQSNETEQSDSMSNSEGMSM